jgi:hypothetical protein
MAPYLQISESGEPGERQRTRLGELHQRATNGRVKEREQKFPLAEWK